MIDEDMEEITKEWSKKFLVPIDDAELSDPDIIGIPLVTRVKHDEQTSAKKKKKNEEVQDIDTDEDDSTSKESGPPSPTRGGGDEVNQEVGGEEGEKQGEGEVTPPK
jgi:hypothetical protein